MSSRSRSEYKLLLSAYPCRTIEVANLLRACGLQLSHAHEIITQLAESRESGALLNNDAVQLHLKYFARENVWLVPATALAPLLERKA